MPSPLIARLGSAFLRAAAGLIAAILASGAYSQPYSGPTIPPLLSLLGCVVGGAATWVVFRRTRPRPRLHHIFVGSFLGVVVLNTLIVVAAYGGDAYMLGTGLGIGLNLATAAVLLAYAVEPKRPRSSDAASPDGGGDAAA